ncbi:TPA: phospholipase D family protein [Salmonella enterica]|nr:phospholipase D family protein [Salmonella enterica]
MYLSQIMDSDNDLSAYLLKKHDSEITIVTAFASATQGIVDKLLSQGNKLKIIVGTINAFTDPAFIKHCAQKKRKNIRLSVDFRGQESIHWKLYLINPDTVIIGSANFTQTGLNLARDTCVIINDAKLFNDYQQRINKILATPNVINAEDPGFSQRLAVYADQHKKSQQRLIAKASDKLFGLAKWLQDDYHHHIKIFVWNNTHPAATKKIANDLLVSEEEVDTRLDLVKAGIACIRDFYTYKCDREELPWEEGDIVLCFRRNGTKFKFEKFERIIHHKGINYMYSFKRDDKDYPKPFRIPDNVKKQIALRADDWYEEDKTILTRQELLSLLE